MIKNWTPSLPTDPSRENELFTELMFFAKTKDDETKEAYRIFSKLLINRNINTVSGAIEFNNLKLEQLHDPFLMMSMDKAVSRIENAISKKEKIMVYGDYDVDGTTSVALMVSYLKELTNQLIYYIPDRYTEGYGISQIGIDSANEQNVDLIIALDCGIKAVEKVDYANSLNIDFIICDHHTPGDKIPNAIAVLDPKRPDCNYPYKELSGCGIGFKLCQALQKKLNTSFNLTSLLDLTAISIACDIVPVTGENRILASLGLNIINSNPRASIQILLGEKKQNIRISDLVFQIGPKINAAGRISKGKTSVDLLLATKSEEIKGIGILINEFNEERKDEDKRITAEALDMIASDPDLATKNSTVLYHPNWHKGVIGIVASRVIEHHYKPTIILTDSKNDIIGGSVRSVKDFNVYNALEKCTGQMIQFGGHKYAAGLTLKKSQLPEFIKKFEMIVSDQMTTKTFTPSVSYDCEITLDQVSGKLKSLIDKLEPFGPKNMSPTFITNNVIDSGKSRAVGGDKSHLKIEVTDPNTGTVISGIAFGFGHLEHKIQNGIPFNIAYGIDINIWRERATIQLMVKDIQFTDKK